MAGPDLSEFGTPAEDLSSFGTLDGAKPEGTGLLRRVIADPLVSAAKGIVGLGEGVVGVGDLLTGGSLGKAAQGAGYRPKEAKDLLDEFYSDDQKAANKRVQDAKGFLPTVGEMVTNPSTIAHGIIESAPSMLGGAAVAKGLTKVAPLAGMAIGEGTLSAGSTAEQIRQQTKDGLLTGEQSAIAAGSGALTAALTLVGGKIANKFGFDDIDQLMAGAKVSASQKGTIRRGLESMASEGLFEELPQSAQEQIAQNIAVGKPWSEGVAEASAQGMMVGAAQGGGATVFSHLMQKKEKPADDLSDQLVDHAKERVRAGGGESTATSSADPVLTEAGVLRKALSGQKDKLTPDEQTTLVNNGHAVETENGLVMLPAGRRRLTELQTTAPAATVATVDDGAHAAATSPNNELPEPTEAQIGKNATLGHSNVGPFDISFENPQGSVRKSKADAPVQWETTMQDHYGYYKGNDIVARAPDKEHVDAFVKPGTPVDHVGPVYVIDQNHADGKFDEPKVMNGYGSRAEAVTAYLRNYQKDWAKNVRGVTELSTDEMHKRLKTPDAFLKPQPEATPLTPEEMKHGNSTQQHAPAAKGAAAPTKAAEPAKAAAPSKPVSAVATPGALPKELAGAKPRYNFGAKAFELTFENDVDRAAYISAQTKRSKRDADYVKFATKAAGIDEAGVRAHGARVRDSIKAMAKDATPGTLHVPALAVTKAAPAKAEVKPAPAVKQEVPIAGEPSVTPEEWEKRGVKYARRKDGTLKTKDEYTSDEWKAYTDSVIEAKLPKRAPAAKKEEPTPQASLTLEPPAAKKEAATAPKAEDKPAPKLPAERRAESLMNKEPPGGWTDADKVPKKAASAAPAEAAKEPSQMTRAEFAAIATVSRTGKDMRVTVPGKESVLIPGTASKEKAIDDAHKFYFQMHELPTIAATKEPAPLPKTRIVKRAIEMLGSVENFQKVVDEHLKELANDDITIPAAEMEDEINALADSVLAGWVEGTVPKYKSVDFEPKPELEGKEFPTRTDPVFPAPEKTVQAKKMAGAVITQSEADALLASWKAEAQRIGREEDRSNQVIISMYDRTGVWTKPYEDAGYTIVRYDLEHGDDLIKFFPLADIKNIKEAGFEIVGVIGQPPCTSFAVSGARWWAEQHDKPSKAMVAKKYGDFAAEYFDSPREVAQVLGSLVAVMVENANPTQFYVLENPVGRIAKEIELPKPTLTFDPSNFGDPYTKKTLTWGEFNPNLPTANVEATEGSRMHKLRGDNEADKMARSATPEGFAYAFFMANNKPNDTRPPAQTKPAVAAADAGKVSADDFDALINEVQAERAAPASEAAEHYQWKRNKEGGQKFGNIESIMPITGDLFRQYIQGKLEDSGMPFQSWQKGPGAGITHLSIFKKADDDQWSLGEVGTLENLRPTNDWALRVDSFDSDEAKAHGAGADSESAAAAPKDETVEFTVQSLRPGAAPETLSVPKNPRKKLPAERRAEAAAKKDAATVPARNWQRIAEGMSPGAAMNMFEPGMVVRFEGQEGEIADPPTIPHGKALSREGSVRVKMSEDRMLYVDARKLEVLSSKRAAESVAPAAAVPGGGTVVGTNTKGDTVYQDAKGVRYLVSDGVKMTETVFLRPTRDGIKTSVQHEGDYLTAEEAAAAAPAKPPADTVIAPGFAKLDALFGRKGTSPALADATETVTPTIAQLETILTVEERQAAALELGADEWNAVTAKTFIGRYADWLQQGAKSIGDKLSELFAKVLHAAKTGLLSIAVAMNINIAQPLPTINVEATQQTLTEVRERPRAEFNGVAASADARITADWFVRNEMADGKPFLIADKSHGVMYAFDADGELIAKAPALFGASKGDVLTDEQANKPIADSRGADKITPAGVFKSRLEADREYGKTLTFANFKNSALAVHRVYLGTPSEKRMERLKSATAADNRISYGCINALPEFVDEVLIPHFPGDSQVIVLPDSSTAEEFFGINDSEFETVATNITPESTAWGEEHYAGVAAVLSATGRNRRSGSVKRENDDIDEDVWAQAKPSFDAAFQETVVAGKSLKEFVRQILDSYNEAIIPYLKRWHQEQAASAQTEAPAAVEWTSGPADGNSNHTVHTSKLGMILEKPMAGGKPFFDVAKRKANGQLDLQGSPMSAFSLEEAKTLLGDPNPAGLEKSIPAADNTSEDTPNERNGTDSESTEALGPLAAQADGRPDAGGDLFGGDARGGSESAEGNRRPDAAGVQGTRSRGSRAKAVHSAAAGGGRRVKKGATPAAPNIPGTNFRITDEVRLGQGGEAEKFRDNLAAVRALKAIESENRRATPDEQRILARYVGWGGLANAFSDDEGNFKPAWDAKGKELAALLTAAELKAARRSTRNAHYTSQTIVTGIWDAVQRLGYKGGMVLESSMGTGNFIGLMPDEVRGGSHVVGIEYDNLTSRIAQMLYPQATVLHSGVQKVPLPDGEFDLNIGNPPFGNESLRFQFKPSINGFSIHNQFFLAGMDTLKPGGVQAMVVSRYLLDAQDTGARQAMAKKARLLGAIRLPDTAFKENARTDVVTDILFFQRLDSAEESSMAAAFDALNAKQSKDRDTEAERRAAAAMVPSWVKTTTVADPLGGEAMIVNNYFADHPEMVVGRLERSGKMQFSVDENGDKAGGVNVKLEPGQDYEQLLRTAIDSLPENVIPEGETTAERTADRFKTMSDGLRIAISGLEAGSVVIEDGKLSQIVERETPSGEYELSKRELNAASPWSQQLMMNADGKWYRVEVKTDAEGKPVKAVRDGKVTKLNVYERTVYESEDDIPGGMLLGESRLARLKQMVELRDLTKAQLVLESEDAAVAEMDANRRKLAKAYKEFTKAHGLINSPTNSALVSEMPDGALVQALEFGYRPEITEARAKKINEKARPESATPAPILSQRVVPHYAPPTKAASPTDALSIALSETGRVDMARIASLLGVDEAEAIARMFEQVEKPLIFKDPETETWETRDAYLSGSVKRKLAAAREQGLAKNIEALEKVQPEPWGADKVTAILGSSWIPADTYADFVKHITGADATVRFSPLTNTFMVSGSNQAQQAMEWSSTDAPATWLIDRVLNSMAIRITFTDSEGKTHLKEEETALAQLKAKQIEAEFADWVFQDGERRNKLVDIFNEKFNTRVNRQFDGSHLTLPGKVPDAIIEMRRHQKNAIWRGISQRFNLYDHVVGAGKTFTYVARAMERRRMGLSRKPTMVVPNHMVEQITSDIYRLYPGAKVLSAGKKDFEKKRRRKVFAKIATGDWDIVVLPHSSFGFIDIAPETEERYLSEELRLAKQAIEDAQEQAEEDGHTGFRKPFNVKEAERLAEKIQARMDTLKDRKRDRLLTFEQMGIDDLTIDEAHEFKNLFYSSRLTNVRGMNDKTGSQKAFDLYNKVRVLSESPTGTVTFGTGTPISNSAVEMYQMMRYLAGKELKELGIEHFDAWRALFVDTSTKWEPTESGRLKEVNRLGRTWSNMRSLMDLYYAFTDAVSIDDIKKWYAEDNQGAAFPVPKVKGGARQTVVVKPTVAQTDALTEILEGFDALPNITDPKERNATRLRLMDRAKKVSLDIRALDRRSTSTEKGGKLEAVSKEAHRIYKKWSKDKGTQLLFLDRSVPKAKGDDKIIKQFDALIAERDKALATGDEEAYRKVNESLEQFDSNEIDELRHAQNAGWNAYQQIKDNLVAMGVPASEIRFVQEANNDQQKQALFDSVNAGEVRVLIGSTPRMGAGTNVQKRLVGLHHVDVTWKPSDIEQREGRGIRQGNSLLDKYGDDFELEILAYATERTVDAKLWDVNSTKLKTINGIRKYSGEFTMDFQDDDAVGMAEMAALASGDPLLLERVKLGSEIDQMELFERAFRRKQWGVKDQIQSAERALRENPGKIEAEKKRAAAIDEQLKPIEEEAKARRVTVEGTVYEKDFDALKAATDAATAQQKGDPKAKYSIDINGKRVTSKDAIIEAVETALGDSTLFDGVIEGKPTFRALVFARALVAEGNKILTAFKDKDGSDSVEVGEIYGFKADLDVSKNKWGFTAEISLTDEDGSTIVTGHARSSEGEKFTTQYMRALVDDTVYRLTNARRASTGYLEQGIKDAEANLPRLRSHQDDAFPQAEALAEKRRRLEEIIVELAAAAPAKAAAEPEVDAEDGDEQATDDKPAFSRASSTGSVSAEGMQDYLAPMLDRWTNAPKVMFHASIDADTVPEVIRNEDQRQRSQGASGQVEGVWHRGTVHLFADAIGSRERAMTVLFHEALGHYGLRGVFGKQFDTVLNQIMRAQKGAVERKAKEYGLDMTKETDRLMAAEEVLAELAQTRPEIGFVRRAIAAVRNFLRSIGVDIQLSDDDIIANYILPARRFVENGIGRSNDHQGDAVPKFERSGADTRTVEADGVRRPITNSSGKPIAPTTQAQIALWKWAGDTKVVDEQGRLVVMYHGTGSDFSTFAMKGKKYPGAGANYRTPDGAAWFTPSRDTANWASNHLPTAHEADSDNPTVMPVYLSVKNPLVLREPTDFDFEIGAAYPTQGDLDRIKELGHDGIIISSDGTPEGASEIVVFQPTQIKSAIGNRGTFDANDPNIMFSRSSSAPTAAAGPALQAKARDVLTDLFDSSRELNRWWHGTVGTQQHKASVNKDFKKVYDEAQDYLSDTSRFANEAANLAPDLLPTIESMKDLKKKAPAKADIKAVSDALFDGTLYGGGSPLEGRVWSDEELLERGMNDNQIKLYRQALDATNKSLDTYAASIIWKLAAQQGLNVNKGGTSGGTYQLANWMASDRITQLRASIKEAGKGADTTKLQKQVEELEAFQKAGLDVDSKAQQLMEHGYFPAIRFGKYAVYAVQDDGDGGMEQLHFGMHESQFAANQAARALAKEYPDATITKGVMSQEGWRLYQGLSLDAVQLFAEHMTDDKGQSILADPMIQGFLRAATNERSLLKRHIHRKGIAGFSEDIPRALAQFTVSSARASSSAYHMVDMTRSANDIKAGDVKDEAVKLVKYLQDPQEEAQWIRGFLFFNFLGGSVASAAVNLTQPAMVTAPYLSQFTSYAKAVAAIARAAADVGPMAVGGQQQKMADKLGAALARDFKRGITEGLVSPQEIHQLRAEAGPNPVGGLLGRKFMHVWGSLFSLAEQFNRGTTFVAAWRIAEELGEKDKYAFAKRAVEDTQFVYNKASRPNWARGTIGSTVFTFKQFSISYIEMAKRLYGKDKKAFALLMLSLFVMAGAEGLPFAEDIEDALDTLGQWLGYSTNTKKSLRKLVVGLVGKDAAEYVLHGISAGLPIDIAGRMGMHNLIPGTALLKPSEKDKMRDVQELVGPVGGVARNVSTAAEALVQGKTGAAVSAMMPTAIANVLKAVDMAQMGAYRDTQGKKVADSTAFEALAKGLGFQPAEVARGSRAMSEVKQDIDYYRLRQDGIADKWAQGIVEKDPAGIEAAKAELKAWNTQNPDQLIQLKPQQINQRVLAMRRTRAERVVSSAPKGLKGQVRDAIVNP